MAAPRLAMAGKQNEQPMAAITAPREPDLSPNRVTMGSILTIPSTLTEVDNTVDGSNAVGYLSTFMVIQVRDASDPSKYANFLYY